MEKKSYMQPAVFLDRDGTLIEDRGHVGDEADVVFYPETVPALKRLMDRFRLFMVTNQPGIAKGDITPADVERINGHVVEHLAAHGIDIIDVYVCPHQRSDGCSCIKPNPHFLLQAARDYGIELKRSFVVGDHPSDVELADNTGAHGIYVLSGHGRKHRPELEGDVHVEPGIAEAADWILRQATSLVSRGARIIREGGVVVFPTETVYGIGADALNPDAVARIFEIKQRPLIDPLIVHVAEMGQVETLAEHVPPPARRLAERFWPGPLTMVLPKRSAVPDLVTAGLPSVAVRMPEHPMARRLIREAACPVAAPSANMFGKTSPTRIEHIEQQMADAVDAVIDGGPCPIGVESTIISFCAERPTLLRPGGTPLEEIERMIGKVSVFSKTDDKPLAPGMLERHYAPRTPLVLEQDGPTEKVSGRVGRLAFQEPEDDAQYAVVEVLSPSGDLREAAANLYAALHRLDAQELDRIVAGPFPERGLGRAILDRLQRASGPPTPA